MSERHSRLAANAAMLSGAHVLCVGDIMLDRFVSGSVDRISPEAPVPVMRIATETSMLGGAGNVARNLVGVNAQTHFLAMIGDDAAGREVAEMLAKLPGVEPILEVIPGRETSIKTRYVAGGQQLLRADRETAALLPNNREAALIAQIDRAMGDCGAVVLSDYGKGMLTDGLIRAVIERAHRAEIPVIVDPKGRDYTRYRGATLLTPNRKELYAAAGAPTATDADVAAAARTVIAACGVAGVVATRSRDGMTLVIGEDVHHLPAEAREVFDVSGAGDTVAATLAAALAVGVRAREAAELSNVAAGVVVGKTGTAAITLEDLTEALRHQDIKNADDKILSFNASVRRIAEWKNHGLRVGFTNGCFDLLHPGHLSLLRQARAACDRLIVGVNTDASVKRLKGEGRPIQSEAARAGVLAALSMVDAVTLFSGDTPIDLITAFKPHALIKGADYTVETVVGHEVVRAHGGRVVLARLEQGQSTTRTIARINGDAPPRGLIGA